MKRMSSVIVVYCIVFHAGVSFSNNVKLQQPPSEENIIIVGEAVHEINRSAFGECGYDSDSLLIYKDENFGDKFNRSIKTDIIKRILKEDENALKSWSISEDIRKVILDHWDGLSTVNDVWNDNGMIKLCLGSRAYSYGNPDEIDFSRSKQNGGIFCLD